MKQQIKKGQNPTRPNVSAKTEEVTLENFSEFLNQPSLTDLPANVKKELADKKLEGRWIDMVQWRKNQGFHKRGWAPYKFDCLTGQPASPLLDSNGQYEGYLLRQSMVLAVKTSEEAQKRRNFINARTKLQSNPGQMHQKALKDALGPAAKVIGYEESDFGDDE